MDIEFLPLQDALAGEYSFERELGRGGMGVVYLARDVQLDRPVAIKVLPAALAASDDVKARFLREARTAASLSHPNIVPIHRVGELAGIPFFVMTFVDGPALGERLRDRGPVSPSVMSQILRDVAQALGYAHSRGIVHRDIKPDNILLDTATGRAMVTDFGIAAVAGESREGPVAGTVGFISPEQLAGAPADGRSDLYSLGVVAHLTLTGAMPDETAPNVPARADVSPTLATAIAKCLAPDPNQRFADAEALVAALDSTTAVARSNLPLELRSWASDQVPLLPLYGFLSFTGLGTAIMSSSGLAGGRLAIFGLVMVSLPAIPVLVYQLLKTKRALSAGYRLSDLRFALRAWRSERLAELDRARATEKRWIRIASRIPLISALVFAGSASQLVLRGSTPSAIVTHILVGNLSVFVGVASLAALSVFGLPLVPRALYRRMVGRARGWLWNSRFGTWLAGRLAPRGGGIPLAAFRPTEMAIEVAIGDLFAALPDEYRELLRDLPAIAGQLTARATELREVVAAGAAAGSDASDQVWEKVKSTNATRLKETVTALERLRIGLLRLQGGIADLRPVTTALEAARGIDRDLERLVEAQQEVSSVRRILSFERRSPSPA